MTLAGLRPGEKLYEELLVKTEELDKTPNSMIFIERDTPLCEHDINVKLEELKAACENANEVDYQMGLGRFDIQLSPLVSGIPGFLFEFKHTKDERVNLAVLADSALQQINEKKYDTELRNAGVNSIIKIGIAFRGKNAVVKRG